MGVASRTLGEPDPLPEGYREKHLASGRFTIGYAGTVGTSNALDVYFLAATAMRDDPRFQFLVVGDGDLLDGYKLQYAHLPNLTFGPKVARGSVPLVLAECDLLYVSMHHSRIWEFGLSLNKFIDYMLAARPIVASYDGFRSMINEADCGTFVPAGSVEALTAEIERYAAMSPAERDQIGQRGRRWLLRNRTYEALAEDYLQILFPDPARVSRQHPLPPRGGTFPS
jgi:glycosyltransferase involved in cell wall biosynthesis